MFESMGRQLLVHLLIMELFTAIKAMHMHMEI